jgi:sialate O-acetylesterase
MKKEGNKIVVTFKHVGPGGLYALDVDQPRGFTIASDDKVFHNAQAKITGPNTVEVWAEGVAEPVAVRYAWAANPICNLYGSREIGLPVTPFRSDDWKGVTAENK